MPQQRVERFRTQVRTGRPRAFLLREGEQPVHGTLHATMCNPELSRLLIHPHVRVIMLQPDRVQVVDLPDPVQPAVRPFLQRVIAGRSLDEFAAHMRPAPGQDQDTAENAREFLVGGVGVTHQDRAGTDAGEQLGGSLGIAPRVHVEPDRVPRRPRTTARPGWCRGWP